MRKNHFLYTIIFFAAPISLLFAQYDSERIDVRELYSAEAIARRDLMREKKCRQPQISPVHRAGLRFALQRLIKGEEHLGPAVLCKILSPSDSKGWVYLDEVYGEQPPVSYVMLEAKGMTHGDKYYFNRVNMYGIVLERDEFVVDADGRLISSSGLPLHERYFSSQGNVNGDYDLYLFENDDPEKCVVVMVSPHPLAYRWRDGAYVYVVPDFYRLNYHILGYGFQPGEELQFVSSSSKETREWRRNADDGRVETACILTRKGIVPGGVDTLVVRRSGREEEAQFSLAWGSKSRLKEHLRPTLQEFTQAEAKVKALLGNTPTDANVATTSNSTGKNEL